MTTFDVHTKDTAAPASAELLAGAEKAFGFIPNLLGTFAESPSTLKGYMALGQIFDESSFTATEQQTVLLTVSRYNECHYCLAAHSTIAGMKQVPADVVAAIRDDRPIEDSKLDALRTLHRDGGREARLVVRAGRRCLHRGGLHERQVFEVILGIAFKTISNYVNHVADTPVDDAFAANAWRPPIEREAG